MRAICQGAGVDLGTAAAFREQWSQPVAATQPPVPLVLHTHQAPGDAVVMTAAVYSLHRAHPGRYVTAVSSEHAAVFLHNPDVTECDGLPLVMHYPAIMQANTRAVHFMQAYCEFLGSALGIHVPLFTERPRLYFDTPARASDYWVIAPDVKDDFTCKRWRGWQEVVDRLPGIQFVQVGLGGEALRGVERVRTSLRALFEVIRNSTGVLCGVSLPMHVAAALEKPCIVIAGGREPPTWEQYSTTMFLHTIGRLPCCRVSGCWKSRIEDCVDPVGDVPRCNTLVTPEEVANVLLSRVQSS